MKIHYTLWSKRVYWPVNSGEKQVLLSSAWYCMGDLDKWLQADCKMKVS